MSGQDPSVPSGSPPGAGADPRQAVPATADDSTGADESRIRQSGVEAVEHRSGGRVLAFPARRGKGRSRPRMKAAIEGATPPRPEFLASELLADDLTPRAPMAGALRASALTVGLAGVGAMVFLGPLSVTAWVLAGLFAALAGLAVAPVDPVRRGLGLAAVATVGGVSASAILVQVEPGATLPWGALATALLASALLFRAAHRVSPVARGMVAAGLVGLLGWWALDGGLGALLVSSLAWQAWIGPALRLAVLVIGLLAGLSFLDPQGSGGASWMAAGLVVWLGGDVLAELAVSAFPAGGAVRVDLGQSAALTRLALPLFVAVAAAGLAQLWVSGSLAIARRGR